MRTGRSLTVCWSLLPGGGLLQGPRGDSGPGGLWSRGVSPLGGLVLGGVSSQGVCSWGGGLVPGVWSWGGYVPACTDADPPVDRQTPVKILPWLNFVAAGNKKAIQSNANRPLFDSSCFTVNKFEYVWGRGAVPVQWGPGGTCLKKKSSSGRVEEGGFGIWGKGRVREPLSGKTESQTDTHYLPATLLAGSKIDM